MNNFEFHNPVQIVFGKDSVDKLPALLPKGKKIMLTYGQNSIKASGLYDKVHKLLSDFTVVDFGGIEPNPRFETLMKAVAICREQGIDFLLAVGGGSVADGTKFIAAATPFKGSEWDILAKGAAVTAALPMGCVLTLPATGSEMNGGAVISRNETTEKLAFHSKLVMPVFSVLDPTLCFTLPKKQVANGVVDAFVHVMEQYLTYPAQAPLQDRMAESILQTLVEEGPKVVANPENYEAMANFMWSATMALNGVIGSGVPSDWSTHVIGHELTAFHGLDHAQTLAIVLPGVMTVMLANKQEKILQYGERVFGVTSGSVEARIQQTIAKTEGFFESLGVPTRLSAYSIDQQGITPIVERFEQRGWKIGERGDMTAETIKQILHIRL